jgi:uncharacterized repeat protein (TIGR01451 family)
MPEFLAETYTPRDAAAGAGPRAGDLARAAGQVSQPGARVRFLGAIAVPAEETCFYLYQAPAAGADRAGDDGRRAAPRTDHPGRDHPATRPGPARRRRGRRRPVTPISNALTEETTMPPHTSLPARAAAGPGAAAIHRRRTALARAALALGVLAAAAAGMLAGASPAAAAPAVLYAYAGGTAAAPASCPQDTATPANPAAECSLAGALNLAGPGDTIDLATPGGTAHYVGNWTVSTDFTADTTPVTIEAAPGLASQPVLDGNNGNSTGCSTTSCYGPVLTVPGGKYVALSGITIADGKANSFSGGLANAGTVTITGSTFTGDHGGDGGAIDTGDGAFNGGTGSVTVTASTFTGNTAFAGGAIDIGDNFGGGSVQVTASTFSGNTASYGGGAIGSGAGGGRGSVTVTGSTFTGNTAAFGGTIASGAGLGGTVQVAGDLFDGSCYQPGGTWTDGGYNAGTDTSCFKGGPGDTSGTAVHTDLQPGLTGNGGPTQTIEPTTGNPAIGVMTVHPVTVTLGGSQVTLCPATDQRGYSETPGGRCDAGAVQTTGAPPLTLADAAAPGSFSAAGQVITYADTVTNFGAGTLTGITVTDPAVPGLSCPAASLPPGNYETCTGAYTTTAADVAAGKVTDTATGTATTATGVPVTAAPATVTVARGWPPQVAGTAKPAAHAAEGYYLGVTTNTWQLLVTHPGTTKVTFTGQITVPTGALGHLSLISPATGHQVTLTGRVLTFTLPDSGTVTGFRFTTSKAPSITLTLNIAGHPATTSQLFLGGTAAHPATGSPLTFTW